MFVVGMVEFQKVWRRIIAHRGEVFTQIRDRKFTYSIKHNQVIPDRTNQLIPRSDFKKAFGLCPLMNTVPLQDLVRGPAYVYAILMDRRTRENDW
jgi:hypothetical protein